MLVVIASAIVPLAGQGPAAPKTVPLKVIEVTEPDGQILSYRHLAGSIDVHMRGTRRARDARIKLKIGSRPGFVELDINRGGISGLTPAYRLGKDFLTYVLWAVSIDGRASNLGEITFEDDRPIPVNLTTPYQTFWLMVTAEPNYAVVDPSPQVVLYSAKEGSASDSKAIAIRSDLFYFTHYSAYESVTATPPDGVPNQLLQARKAVELASKSSVLAGDSIDAGLKEEEYTRKALVQAKSFLVQAEGAYARDPSRPDVIQYARTAAQSAENARALAMGAVGGLLVRQLENELIILRDELAKRQGPDPSAATEPVQGVQITSEPPRAVTSAPLAKQPALWFAAAGWGLAIVLLFRRKPI